MAKISIWNIKAANLELSAAAEALAPALEKAGIKTISVDGKSVVASEASLAAQITALLAAQPVVADSQNAAQALVSNETISAELDKTNVSLVLATTAVEALTRDKAALTGQLATANASVQSLTVSTGVLVTERDAAVRQFTANSLTIATRDTELSNLCLACGCLDLRAEDGKPLAADATAEAKLAAASKISYDARSKSYQGALNAAFAKANLPFGTLPGAAAKTAGAENKKLTATERCLASVAAAARK